MNGGGAVLIVDRNGDRQVAGVVAHEAASDFGQVAGQVAVGVVGVVAGGLAVEVADMVEFVGSRQVEVGHRRRCAVLVVAGHGGDVAVGIVGDARQVVLASVVAPTAGVETEVGFGQPVGFVVVEHPAGFVEAGRTGGGPGDVAVVLRLKVRAVAGSIGDFTFCGGIERIIDLRC